MIKFIIDKWLSPYYTFNSNIKYFLFGSVLAQLGMGIFMVMYNLYIRALGYPEQMNGQIISFTALASAIILIPAGFLSDRIGRKKMMVIGLIAVFIILIVRSIAEQKLILLSFSFLFGLFFAFVQVSIIPFMAENSKKEERVVLFSLNAAITMFSVMIGNIIGGFLTDILQLVFEFSELYALKITLTMGSIFFFFALIPIFRIKENRLNSNGKASFSKITYLKNRDQFKVILKFTIAAMIIGLGSGLVIPYLNLYFRDRFDASNSSIGIVVSLGQLATAIAMLIGPAIVKRIGEVRSVVFLQLSSIPFLLLTGFTNIYFLAATGFLIRQALMNAGNPIQQSLMMSKIDDNMKGLANSFSAMVFQLGWAVMGPVSTSIVAKGGSYWGYAIVFSATAVLYIIGSLYFYWMFGRGKKWDQAPGVHKHGIM